MVKLLLFWDVDIAVPDDDGMLAIDVARKYKQLEIVQLLVNPGADRGTGNDAGRAGGTSIGQAELGEKAYVGAS